MTVEETIDKLMQVKQPHMAAALRLALDRAAGSALTIEECVGLMVDREWTERDNRRTGRRIKDARLGMQACIEDLWCDPARGLDKAVARSLGTCQWVRAKQNEGFSGKSTTRRETRITLTPTRQRDDASALDGGARSILWDHVNGRHLWIKHGRKAYARFELPSPPKGRHAAAMAISLVEADDAGAHGAHAVRRVRARAPKLGFDLDIWITRDATLAGHRTALARALLGPAASVFTRAGARTPLLAFFAERGAPVRVECRDPSTGAVRARLAFEGLCATTSDPATFRVPPEYSPLADLPGSRREIAARAHVPRARWAPRQARRTPFPITFRGIPRPRPRRRTMAASPWSETRGSASASAPRCSAACMVSSTP